MTKLTHAEIMALTGRELDAAVGRHIMGYPMHPYDHYSTDRNALYEAEQVIEEEAWTKDYLDALYALLPPAPSYAHSSWTLRTADPELCCRAMLIAMMEAGE